MKNNKLNMPPKLVSLLQTMLVSDEEICGYFHESFNWDITATWVILTTYRIIVMRTLPWNTDIEDFRLRDINLELRRDNIGPYDTIEFKSTNTVLFEIAVLRNRREEAQRFMHKVSENMQAQMMYSPQQVKNNKIVMNTPEKISDNKVIQWCNRKLRNLRQMGVISDEEFLDEIENNPECKDI